MIEEDMQSFLGKWFVGFDTMYFCSIRLSQRYLFTFIFVLQIAVSEPAKFTHKCAIFFSEKWNIMDVISIIVFWVSDWVFLTRKVSRQLNIFCC